MTRLSRLFSLLPLPLAPRMRTLLGVKRTKYALFPVTDTLPAMIE
jgi:hypothetical protein